MPDFALVALDGAYHSSAGALLDSFALARDRIESVFSREDQMRMETRLRVLSLDGGPVALFDGRRLAVDGAVGADDPYAFVWLPAFRAGGQESLERRILRSQSLIAWLREQARSGAIIGASGASTLLLMVAKLTDGVPIPVARALLPVARAMFPHFRQEERAGLVDTKNLLIANGLASDLQLVVRAFERTFAPEIGRWLTSVMGLDREEETLLSIDPSVATAQIWLEQHYTRDFRIVELSSILSMSQSTLIRRFRKSLGMTPKAYVQHLRLLAAQRMLEKSNRSIDKIAALVGFSDSRLFRLMFREQTGMTASEWRTTARLKTSAKSQ